MVFMLRLKIRIVKASECVLTHVSVLKNSEKSSHFVHFSGEKINKSVCYESKQSTGRVRTLPVHVVLKIILQMA